MTTEETRFGEESVGPWFDGSRGIYIGVAVIDEAGSYGWPEYDALKLAFDNREEESQKRTWCSEWEEWLTDHEHYYELWEEAEEFMNTLTEEGYYFGASEGGDWGLWPIEEEEEEDGD